MYVRKPLRRAQAKTTARPSDWVKLCRNDEIEVHMGSQPAVKGTIDMISDDRNVLWMIRNDGGGRTMLCAGDEVTVVRLTASYGAD